MRILILFILILQFTHVNAQDISAQQGKVQIANLNNENTENFESIRKAFKQRNVGYDMIYKPATQNVDSREYTQVIFVQSIEGITNQDMKGNATIYNDGTSRESEAIVGDILILQEGEMLRTNKEMGFLIISVPEKPKNELPSFIRPDWDPNITDVPGGCATEIDAYRRILLTWKKDVGEYIYHSLNAHRVRIRDSFSHYHPEEGGFDEFYLVQMVEPGAKLITSEQTELILNPDRISKSETENLMQEYELEVGDLVYLPRGVVHRGYGGVLAQVITIPGFIPGSEIGVDHHLRAINERLNLSPEDALPYNVESSGEAVIR